MCWQLNDYIAQLNAPNTDVPYTKTSIQSATVGYSLQIAIFGITKSFRASETCGIGFLSSVFSLYCNVRFVFQVKGIDNILIMKEKIIKCNIVVGKGMKPS